ncbi:SUA5/yciO/yrdC domain protein [Hyella patelloides LEGE 07179]|uniref:L-threonylcarbamoyladenylate synthase n=1 Tax=Hyella patelloides LEGE 07179 TaxID=945734 RepID=A0A563VXU7_9CYAN|nr:L-threonylcarbamoyladenylate synthase [Hyella patelloides]VEP16240.1 SUA5/yciO/yrdC domain protein [Hyella patelloides LEGE 07179]
MVLVSQAELIEKAIANCVVSFPTDTVPALAIKPDRAAVLYQVKQRPESKPLILMGASLEDLLPYIEGTTEERERWKAIANRYFPGALTLVLPASALVPAAMNPTNSRTIGIRVPNHQTAQEILSQTGVLATTSANLSGQSSLVTTEAINRVFPQITILEDQTPNKPQGSGLPSTVVQWTGLNWQILRQGSVNFALEK